MNEKVDIVMNFINSKVFDLQNEILRYVRDGIYEKSIDTQYEKIKEKMDILKFLEDYQLEDNLWEWCHEYYGDDEEGDFDEY